MQFSESKLCLSRIHCQICRNRTKGAQWRELVGRIHDTGGVDFECPIDLPWLIEEPDADSLLPFQDLVSPLPKEEPKPEKVRSARSKAHNQAVECGKLLAHFSYQICDTLPDDSPVVEALNRLAASERRGGCRGCRAKKLYRGVAKAFESVDEKQQNLINDIVADAVSE